MARRGWCGRLIRPTPALIRVSNAGAVTSPCDAFKPAGSAQRFLAEAFSAWRDAAGVPACPTDP